MTKLTILLVLVGLVVGYLAGNFLPLSRFTSPPGKSIKGNAKLEVKLVNEAGKPLPKIEVDIAKTGEDKAGPPEGGYVLTDENGIATFNILPGSYRVFFNTLNFPKKFVFPTGPIEHRDIRVLVDENKPSQVQITLKAQ